MPSVRRRLPRRRRVGGDLTREQRLGLIFSGRRHLFASEEERRAIWLDHRDEFVGGFGWQSFRRPSAWWDYEAAEYFTEPLRQIAGQLEDYRDWFVRNRVPLLPEELENLRVFYPELYAQVNEGETE